MSLRRVYAVESWLRLSKRGSWVFESVHSSLADAEAKVRQDQHDYPLNHIRIVAYVTRMTIAEYEPKTATRPGRTFRAVFLP